MTDKELEEMVKKAATDLGEYFDNVQIHVNWMREGAESVAAYQYGVGNLLARLGQCSEWLTMQNEYARLEARRRNDED